MVGVEPAVPAAAGGCAAGNGGPQQQHATVMDVEEPESGTPNPPTTTLHPASAGATCPMTSLTMSSGDADMISAVGFPGGGSGLEADLLSNDEEKCYLAILHLKSSLIGSNRQKHYVIERGVLPRIIQLIAGGASDCGGGGKGGSAAAVPARLRVVSAQTLGSIAKGMDAHLKALIDQGAVPVLLGAIGIPMHHQMNNPPPPPPPELVEACLRCLKTIFSHPEAPVEYLYAATPMAPTAEDAIGGAAADGAMASHHHHVIPHLISLMPHSVNTQISTCALLTHACKTREHQNILAGFGVVDRAIRHLLLQSPYNDVILPALRLLAFLVFGNEQVAAMVVASDVSYDVRGRSWSLVDAVVSFLDRQRPPEMQLEAARVLTYLYRCGQLAEDDPRIVYKALPCVVRLTREEETVEIRILAAETLAYLIEISAELQRIAAISNHLIRTISSFLWWEPEVTSSDIAANYPVLTAAGNGSVAAANGSAANNSKFQQLGNNSYLCLDPEKISGLTKYQMLQLTRKLDQQSNYCRDMKKAAFRVFAALSANDEDIRKRIIDTDRLMESVVSALQQQEAGGVSSCPASSSKKLQMAAVSCLHSLSRSVQLLRTSFQDYPVWKPLMKILASPTTSPTATTATAAAAAGETGGLDIMVVASSTLCNLLLEFSPSKEPILESGAIDLLCKLTHKFDTPLVLNGVWGLMNMAFRADQRIKVQIITTLGSDQVFRLLSDADIGVRMKTLGLLRNLLSHKTDIDHVMSLYGKQVMQSVVFILEGDNAQEVKEQALCILANIADGDTAKAFIMSNEDVLKKVTHYVVHTSPKLQMAAVVCVHNLAFRDRDPQGAADRQNKLREMGVLAILQQLRNTSVDMTLAEKVKSALDQFEPFA